MSVLYKYAWNKDLDTEEKREITKKTWCYVLKNKTIKQIERGLNTILLGNHKYVSFPPNALEFRELCETHPSDYSNSGLIEIKLPPIDKNLAIKQIIESAVFKINLKKSLLSKMGVEKDYIDRLFQ